MTQKVDVYGLKIESEYYCRGRKRWKQTTLLDSVKEQKLKTFDLPLIGINLVDIFFSCESFTLFLHHCKRMEEVDMKYPIILDDFGQVANGRHRIAKAILRGDTTIKAVRLDFMPKADKKSKKR